MVRYIFWSFSNATLMASTPALNFDFNSTLGALQIGIVVSCVLFGVTTTQTYTYYGRFPNDSRGLKLLVALVWFCEIAHLICIEASHYRYSVLDFSQPEELLLLSSTIVVSLLFSGIIGGSVQAFFSLRIYKLSGRLCIPGLSWMLASSRMMFCIVAVIYGSQPNLTIEGYVVQRTWVFYTLWAVSTANDLLIASNSVYWLHRQRVKADMRTVALVDKLIKWTIETGVIASATTALTVIFFAINKENGVVSCVLRGPVDERTSLDIWVTFYTVSARREFSQFWIRFLKSLIPSVVHANSLLASLNSRATLRAMNDNTVHYSAQELAVSSSEPTVIIPLALNSNSSACRPGARRPKSRVLSIDVVRRDVEFL
ncbi:hypothetical protein B0H17DRAFT_1176649 [Mycena rosella]|uniref:DUF6534 domain-containing protein n=1 Tax=Mycena rosella TaxID=1033263 RepID=A0AAD7GQ74_MYCRO|nr:hypothetical protein B0H17DRAFT_1176649 [Mycena rosella]